MPELKHTFTGGKMDKDNDERIVANGQYRSALNIEVATSEDSDVGAAQNIIGNIQTTYAISGPVGNETTKDQPEALQLTPWPKGKYSNYNSHIAHVVDPETENIYRFTKTEADPYGIWMDRIVEFNNINGGISEKAVLIDIYKVRTTITGVYRGACDSDIYLELTGNTYQIRWGMQLDIADEGLTLEHGVYIKYIERLTPDTIRVQLNVNEENALGIDQSGGAIPFDFFSLAPFNNLILHGDRNLNFDNDRKITGLNIIDGMLFWTDNYSEPKKINIERCKIGSTAQSWDTWRDTSKHDAITGFDIGDFDQHTRLVVKFQDDYQNPKDCILNPPMCGGAHNTTTTTSTATPGCTISSFNSWFTNYNPSTQTSGNGAGVFMSQIPTTNYNPLADCDDGSCQCTVCDQGKPPTCYTVDCYDVHTNLDNYGSNSTDPNTYETYNGGHYFQGKPEYGVITTTYDEKIPCSGIGLGASLSPASPLKLAYDPGSGSGSGSSVGYGSSPSSGAGSTPSGGAGVGGGGIGAGGGGSVGGSNIITGPQSSTSGGVVGEFLNYPTRDDPNYTPRLFGPSLCRPLYVEERHITVIRKGPTMSPSVEMYSYTQPDLNDDGLVDVIGVFGGITCKPDKAACEGTAELEEKYPNGYNPNGATWEQQTGVGVVHTSIFYNISNIPSLKVPGDTVELPINIQDTGEDWDLNDKLSITGEYFNNFGIKKACGITGVITNLTSQFGTIIRITSISPSTPLSVGPQDVYTVRLVQKQPMFELKFPRFSYRYKYEDGEYSVFGPWSSVAFIPEDFDYLPKKGYNLGMTNRIRSLTITDFVPKNIPKDVVQVDLLYKESNSPNVYTVESFRKDDPIEEGSTLYNYWNTPGNGGNFGKYIVTSELIHATVPSNQMLRPWDNVPRVALAQEITANRLIYANYLQNYDVVDAVGAPIIPIFSIMVDSININDPIYSGFNESMVGKPAKSLKSMRTYQLGVVYRDRYGRETPVLTSKSGSIKIPKDKSRTFNKLNVALLPTSNADPNYPDWAESYTYYIKETSNEYYNVAMDRWYNADDGNVWLSFPSSERNKINDDTILILKKQHDNDIAVIDETKYKVISIKNNAPTFIKTENQYWGSLAMMLPPPGWGVSGKPGGWQAGMFSPSGLPLPNHQYLDIYAEYWDQSVFSTLAEKVTCQIRLVQAPGMASNASSGSTVTQASQWYDVASISYVGQPPEIVEEETVTYNSAGDQTGAVVQEVELPATEIQLVRITLEKVLGNELEFCRSVDILDLSRGLMMEARTQIVKDKSQFEGRFFVKVERDAVIEQSIIAPQVQEVDNWQILQSRDVGYLAVAHPGAQVWNKRVYIPFQGELYSTFDGTNTQDSNPSQIGAIGEALEARAANIPIYTAMGFGLPGPKLISSYHAYTGGYKHALAASSAIAVTGDVPAQIPGSNPYGGDISPYHRDYVANAPFTILWPLGPGHKESAVYKDANNLIHYPTPHEIWGDGAGADGYLSDKFAAALKLPGPKVMSNPYCSVSTGCNWPSYTPSEYMPGIGSQSFGTKNPFLFGAIAGSVSGLTTYPQEWDGYNHFHKAAIWDRGDRDHGGWCLDGQGCDTDDFYVYNEDAIHKLGGAWKDLQEGRRTFWRWPLSTGWKRWFIDQAGAASGYSGAGIWDTQNVSMMDISFYGIGRADQIGSRDFNLGTWQYDELAFEESIGTTGTSFRFKQDPDQIVYTITDVKKQEIYNYEAPCGSWGWRDGISLANDCDCSAWANATCVDWDDTRNGIGCAAKMEDRGTGCAQGIWPVHGNTQMGTNSMAGKPAFMSDFVYPAQNASSSSEASFSGGHNSNRRIRLTITLDKKIGVGPHQFHPLYHHCGYDAAADEYYANIQGEYPLGRYNTDSASGGHNSSTPSNGGTPVGVDGKGWDGYNLSSYWNATDVSGAYSTPATGSVQNPGCPGPGETAQTTYENQELYGQHVGLHERFLNYTTIEIVSQYSGDEGDKPMSNNPAVWETEPKEDVGLDIYYAASPTYPINLQRHRNDVDPEQGFYDYSDRGEEYIPVGSTCDAGFPGLSAAIVDGVQGNFIFLNSHIWEDPIGTSAKVPTHSGGVPRKVTFEIKGEGTWYGAYQDVTKVEATVLESFENDHKKFKIKPIVHNERRTLKYFNCFSFSNGVESNRVRDDYNAVTIDRGVKASMPLAEQYEEERRDSSLIFSGIYNSTSGVNSTNQFIQAEPITKDLNPINGSIQKLFTRDTDLVTFCENKVFKILAKKDALFNADGKSNITSNAMVLGQSVPFQGEYGISKNPESFASESYRIYFADKTRGAVLRLSRDGLTNISDYGMKDWFKDNLQYAHRLAGSFDDRKDEYNLSIEAVDPEDGAFAHTVSYTESRKGWVSFKSFIQQDGFSYKNIYYTVPSNFWNDRGWDESPLEFRYGSQRGSSEVWRHHLNLKITALVNGVFENKDIIALDGLNYFTNPGSLINVGVERVEIGMNVSGNGIPIDAYVVDILGTQIQLNKKVWLYDNEELTFTSARNNFYGTQTHSMVTVMFNGDQGSVKRFKTLNYEGTQSNQEWQKYNRGIINYHYLYDNNDPTSTTQGQKVGQIYYDNYPKKGWKVSKIETDLQKGLLSEFIDKENKWYNYIRGHADAGEGDNIDTAEFSLQGLGRQINIEDTPDTTGCLDQNALNHQPTANLPCYNCCLYSEGCLDDKANNYDPTVDSPCASCCSYTSGCTDPNAMFGSFNPIATADCEGEVGGNDTDCCVYCMYGCMDSTALNWVEEATCSDGSCLYNLGCMDNTTPNGCGLGCDGAINYKAGATAPDPNEPCLYCQMGCMDRLATNYDSNATCDDGSCNYCIYGCTCGGDAALGRINGLNAFNDCYGDGVAADNFNPNATCEDFSCFRAGCTDPLSQNYNPSATVDDGSCFTCDSGCLDDSEDNNGNIINVNYNPAATCDCNDEPEFIGPAQNKQPNPAYKKLGWDSCCVAFVCGCDDPIAINHLDDCNGSYNADVNTNCSDSKCGSGTNTCAYPAVTPNTYIKIIQDVSASMGDAINPLKTVIMGPYCQPGTGTTPDGSTYTINDVQQTAWATGAAIGTMQQYNDTQGNGGTAVACVKYSDSIRAEIQDIYSNYRAAWTESQCLDDMGSCTDCACDPAKNGRDKYDNHVTYFMAYEYNIANLGNTDPIHNHAKGVGFGNYAVIGGYFGATATLWPSDATNDPISCQVVGNCDGNTDPYINPSMAADGLTSGAFPGADAIYILTIGDESQKTYYSQQYSTQKPTGPQKYTGTYNLWDSAAFTSTGNGWVGQTVTAESGKWWMDVVYNNNGCNPCIDGVSTQNAAVTEISQNNLCDICTGGHMANSSIYKNPNYTSRGWHYHNTWMDLGVTGASSFTTSGSTASFNIDEPFQHCSGGGTTACTGGSNSDVHADVDQFMFRMPNNPATVQHFPFSRYSGFCENNTTYQTGSAIMQMCPDGTVGASTGVPSWLDPGAGGGGWHSSGNGNFVDPGGYQSEGALLDDVLSTRQQIGNIKDFNGVDDGIRFGGVMMYCHTGIASNASKRYKIQNKCLLYGGYHYDATGAIQNSANANQRVEADGTTVIDTGWDNPNSEAYGCEAWADDASHIFGFDTYSDMSCNVASQAGVGNKWASGQGCNPGTIVSTGGAVARNSYQHPNAGSWNNGCGTYGSAVGWGDATLWGEPRNLSQYNGWTDGVGASIHLSVHDGTMPNQTQLNATDTPNQMKDRIIEALEGVGLTI